MSSGGVNDLGDVHGGTWQVDLRPFLLVIEGTCLFCCSYLFLPRIRISTAIANTYLFLLA